MIDMIKDALSDSDGRASSSPIGMWALVGMAVGGFIFASVIIGHSYFINGVLPNGDSILVYYLGGSATGGVSGSVLYFANQYGNKNTELPDPPVNDSAFEETT